MLGEKWDLFAFSVDVRTAPHRALSCQVWIATFLNTALLVLLVNAALPSTASSASVGGHQLFIGQQTGFTETWHYSVGAGVVFTMAVNCFSPHFYSLYLLACPPRFRERRANAQAVTQAQLNDATKPPPFEIPTRASVVLNIVYVCIMYSPGTCLRVAHGGTSLQYCIAVSSCRASHPPCHCRRVIYHLLCHRQVVAAARVRTPCVLRRDAVAFRCAHPAVGRPPAPRCCLLDVCVGWPMACRYLCTLHPFAAAPRADSDTSVLYSPNLFGLGETSLFIGNSAGAAVDSLGSGVQGADQSGINIVARISQVRGVAWGLERGHPRFRNDPVAPPPPPPRRRTRSSSSSSSSSLRGCTSSA